MYTWGKVGKINVDAQDLTLHLTYLRVFVQIGLSLESDPCPTKSASQSAAEMPKAKSRQAVTYGLR